MTAGWIVRRLLEALSMLLVVSLAAFAVTVIVPGDVRDELKLNPQLSPQTVERISARYGVDRPWPVRYERWLAATVSGDLGYSVTYNVPVATLFWSRAANTALLSAVGTAGAWLLAIPLAAVSVLRRGRLADRLVMSVTTVPLASSDLLIALAALWFAAQTHLLPIGGMTSIGFDAMSRAEQWADLQRHLLLPSIALTLILLPPIYRHLRSALVEAMDSPFVAAARTHGLRPATLVIRYVLSLAANAQISMLGMSIAGLLSASLVVEVVMGWPGLGPLMLEATAARDHDVVLGIIVASAALVWLANLSTDLLLYACDPRIRSSR